MTFDKTVRILLENVTTVSLYHGTLKENLPKIRKEGLVPRVGKFVERLYGKKAVPLIFATNKEGARRVYCTLSSQIEAKIGRIPTIQDFREHGAILEIEKDASRFSTNLSNRDVGSIEKGDFYSKVPVSIDNVYEGDDLVKWIQDTKADWGEFCTL